MSEIPLHQCVQQFDPPILAEFDSGEPAGESSRTILSRVGLPASLQKVPEVPSVPFRALESSISAVGLDDKQIFRYSNPDRKVMNGAPRSSPVLRRALLFVHTHPKELCQLGGNH